MSAANHLSVEEAEDLRFVLDDADMLGGLGGAGERRMLDLWRRLDLWLLAKQGDTDAHAILQREFPGRAL